MIYIDRDKVPIPELFLDSFSSPFDNEILFRLDQTSKFKQARFKQDTDYLRRVKPEIEKLFNNKCCYCESELKRSEIEHFRPTSSVTGVKGRANEGYYWLAYKWFNIYLSCAECNRNKANRFPIKGKRLLPPEMELYNDYKALQEYVAQEDALLIDPCDRSAHQEVHFKYDPDGHLIPQTEKAENTILYLQLNRIKLVKNRRNFTSRINNEISSITFDKDQSFAMKGLLKFLNDDVAFLGLARQLIANWFIANESLIIEQYSNFHSEIISAFEKSIPSLGVLIGQIESETDAAPKRKKRKTSMTSEIQFSKFIEWIEIKNYKCIEYAKFEIAPPSGDEGEKSILLIGENGVGKSTAIQAIALAMMGQKQLQNLNLGNPSKLIRRDSKSKKAIIKVKFNNEEDNVIVEITPNGITSNRELTVKPTVGIGSIRRLPESGEIVTFEDDSSRIMGLFRHDIIYPEIQPWLGNTEMVDSNQFNEAAKTIIDMLMIPDELISEDRMMNRKMGKLTMNVGNGPESIDDMCDGHRSVIAYALYIMRSFSEHWDSAFNAEGLVIIDEIGNHLHPTWKIKVISLLRQVFPRTTFIISTHDPLCLRSAREGEVWVMNKSSENQKISVVQKDIPLGMSIESLLTGNWFYMEHTTDERTSKLIEEHSTEMFSESPDQNRIKDIELQLERTMMQTPFGNTKLDTYLHFIQEIQTESTAKIAKDDALREKLANRIRNQIKS